MNGWKYEWVADLPVAVYDVLLEEMIAHAEAVAKVSDSDGSAADEGGFD